MSKFSFHRSFIVTAAASLLALGACQTIDPFTGESKVSSTVKGGAIGAAGGAVIGAISGKDAQERKKRALIGAGVARSPAVRSEPTWTSRRPTCARKWPALA